MKTVTLEEAQGHLPELADLAERGEEVVITRQDRARFRLVPLESAPQRRIFGQYRGKVQIAADFDAPLPDEFWLGESA